jgi:hypothetical protein
VRQRVLADQEWPQLFIHHNRGLFVDGTVEALSARVRLDFQIQRLGFALSRYGAGRSSS